MLLFLESLLNQDYGTFKMKLAIVGVMWLFVAVAVVLDLISGWRKARERGEARTSYGLRRTVTKTVLYYAMMLFAFMLDCIGTFFYPLPYVTFIASAFLIFIEGKSILEKAHDKDKRKFAKNLQELGVIFDNREDLLKGFIEYVKNHTEEKQDEKN